MSTHHSRLFLLFKYTIYILLTADIYFFFVDEWAAAPHRFANGFALEDIILGFAATIDTAAWVVLLLMFELETYLLDDKHFTRRVTWTLHSLRATCYLFIIYAFYGYASKALTLSGMVPLPDVTDLCTIADGTWAYAIGYEEFSGITLENCGAFSDAGAYLRFPDMFAVVDSVGYANIMGLAWVDVLNSGVWLLVVLILEIDVRLQEKNRLEGLVLRLSNIAKYFLYSILFIAAAYWGLEGSFVDFWDAFLWLVAFIFIELNVLEWRNESLESQQVTTGSPA